MAEIKASDVSRLRTLTGAGMMDCKQALQEANGDYEVAIDFLRKKGQKVANKRADRESSEGAALAAISNDSKFGIALVLNCETDFVAKNDDFVKFAQDIADLAVTQRIETLEVLLEQKLGNSTVAEEVLNKTGVIGEKVELKNFYKIEAESVVAYVHPGNRIVSIVGFSKNIDPLKGRDVAMQIAAMNPVAIDKSDVSQDVIQREIEIGKEQAINEGKTPEMAEKIAVGKLNKFYQESTLLNQEFIKDSKKTVKQYLQDLDKDLTVTSFKRFSLSI